MEGRTFRRYDGALFRVLYLAVEVEEDRPLVIITPMHPSTLSYLAWPLSDFLSVAIRPGSLKRTARFRRIPER